MSSVRVGVGAMVVVCAGVLAGCEPGYRLSEKERARYTEQARAARAAFNVLAGAEPGDRERYEAYRTSLEVIQQAVREELNQFGLVETGEGGPWQTIDELRNGAIDRPGLNAAREVLAGELVRNAEIALDAAVQPKPPFPGIDVDQRFDDQLIPLIGGGAQRTMVKVYAARMRLRAAEGDAAGAISDFRRTQAIAAIVCRSPVMISQMTAGSYSVTGIREIAYGVQERTIGPESAQAWLDVLRDTGWGVDWHTMIEGERLFAVSTVADLHLSWEDPEFRKDWEAQQRELEPVIDSLQAIAPLPEPEWVRRLLPADIDPEAVRKSMPTFEPAEELSPTFDSIGMIVHADARHRTLRNGVSIMLALEVHRGMHGTYPTALGELDLAALGGSLPPDVLGGGSFGYRLLADDPAGRPYLLYSLGLNGVDESGTAGEDGRETPDQSDVVINEPRRDLER